ncbi:hypothetical protein HELRODRAFT_171322 [Helobdella robusta]|uniref:Uncharacterized protein n=1 Tax=Helobdella robusta TaxID=6412 RepID=T1F441_HELRO|nr:hypothetical protein HELRODRAFT_171322 [Helobdella robusta]ESO05664.1 hypothetical protein HELRODRAFT_171322 [Helobdella robusta]
MTSLWPTLHPPVEFQHLLQHVMLPASCHRTREPPSEHNTYSAILATQIRRENEAETKVSQSQMSRVINERNRSFATFRYINIRGGLAAAAVVIVAAVGGSGSSDSSGCGGCGRGDGSGGKMLNMNMTE